MSLWLFWLIVVILLAMVEIMTINLVTIWFVASGVISLIVSFFTQDLLIQFTIFVLGGLILLIITKPLLDKLKQTKDEKLNLERIIGMTGVVTQEIKKNTIGEIKADGKRWSAISERKIPVDSEVIIEAIDGVKLLVSQKEQPQEKEPIKPTAVEEKKEPSSKKIPSKTTKSSKKAKTKKKSNKKN